MTHRRARAVVATCLVAAMTVATGCSSESSETSGEPIPSDFISDSAAPQSEDGLPQDYPRDVAPVVEGEVVSAESGDPVGSFAVTISTDDTVVGAATDAVALLEGAGWQNRSDSSIGDGTTPVAQFFNLPDGGLVILNVVDVRGDAAVSYAVRLP